MSVEIKLPRLLAAAKEFNVGQDTLIDFLAGKGFSRDDLKPTARLLPDMYQALQKEFQGDKVAKAKSDLIDLPKGVSGESRRRREEEEVHFRKEEKKISHDKDKEIIGEIPKSAPLIEPVISEPVPLVEQPPVAEPEIVISQETHAEPVQEFVPHAVEIKREVPVEQFVTEIAPMPAREPEPVAEIPASEEKMENIPEPVETIVPLQEIMSEVNIEEPLKEEKPTNPEITRIEPPEVKGVNVIKKIDLDSIDSSTRPKKGAPRIDKNKKPFKQGETPRRTPSGGSHSVPVIGLPSGIEAKQVAVPEVSAEALVPVITNISAERLTGPKIIGKIELPKDNDTRPKGPSEREKRKRARIPVARRENSGGGGGVGRPLPGGPNRGSGNNTGGPNRGAGGGNNAGGPNRGPAGGNIAGGPNRGAVGGPNRGAAGGPNRGIGGGNNAGGPNRGGGSGIPNRGNDRGPARRDDRIIDEKEIQRKLQETQARLSGGNRPGKGMKARARRDKRREMAEAQNDGMVDSLIELTEFISVSELASLMDVNFAEVIGKCMSLGIMVSINQRLDAEVIELVANEFGFDVKFVGLEDQDMEDDDDIVDDVADLIPRAPIVTIMGHVDHGKTSLLDFIRNANVVSGEAGGITQHIGAYEVTAASGKKVTFLDTPGHEAFTAMRARGAKVTDIAVIVIAADDAVMPQTREAISHAQAANVPMIFAINKIDKDGANPQKIYEQLSGMNILVEEWGGKFQSQEISAKQGLNIDLLLEKILLEAEIQELKANPDRMGTGTVIEATLDKGRGYVTTVLVLNGSLEIGDVVVSGPYFGRVKAMFNERNEKTELAGPSSPALILGLNGAPQAGEKFKVFEEESDAKSAAYKRGQILREQGMRTRKHITLDEIGRRLALGNFKELNVIIKGDVDGSVEALSDSLQKLSTEEIVVNVILKGVGAISENDVTLASASDAIIMGFNVRPNLQASKLADLEGIQIKQYSIIYNAIADIKSAMEGLLEPKIEEKEVATVEIREVFKFDKATVAGCYVLDGRLKRDAKIRLFRDGVLIYPRTEGAFAELGSLKRYKDDVKEVVNNYECGLTLKNYIDLQVGDTLVAIEEDEVKRTL